MERNENDSRPTRRNVLRAGAGALAAGTALLGGGCVGTLPPLGQRVRYGAIDSPDPMDPTYHKWIPEVREIDRNLDDHFRDSLDDLSFSFATPNDLGGDVLGRPFELPRGMWEPIVDYFGQGFEAYDRMVVVGGVIVLLGDVRGDVATETATESGYRAAGSSAGYETFTRSDVPRAVAIRDGAIVWAEGDRAMAKIRTVLDARAGRVPRAYDTREQFARFVDAIGGYPWVASNFPSYYQDGMESFDPLYHGMTFTYDADGAYFIDAWLFPPDESPSKRRLRETIDSNRRARTSRAVDLSVDDGFVTVEKHGSPGTFRNEWNDGPVVDYPQVTWSVDRDRDTGTVTIRHSAGEAIDASLLTVNAVGETRTQFVDQYDRVERGDAITVDPAAHVDDADSLPERLQVRFSSPDGDVMTTMLGVDLSDELWGE